MEPTRKISLLFAAAVLAAAVLAAPALAQPAPAPAVVPNLSVQGMGEVLAAPDEAFARLGVVAQAPTARAAQEEVNRIATAVVAAIRRAGVEEDRIQTSELSLSPVYAQGRPDEEYREPRITGYQATNVVSARLTRLDLLGPVLDAGLAAGANRIEGIGFDLRDDAAARAQALERAVGEAREKAATMARALRVRLVELLEASEGGVSVYTPTFERAQARMAAMDSAAGTPVAAGQVSVSASVTLRYRIAPCPAQGPCE